MSAPSINVTGDELDACPACHRRDVQAWADDGESAIADWWECSWCGAGGAVVRADDPTRTQNGLPVP